VRRYRARNLPLPGVDENRKISSNQDYCVLWISVALLL
jgi:hypothetical protein